MDRTVVFIDEANVYNDARRCFHSFGGPSYEGRILPMRYPGDWPKSRPEQKGVDVQIAIDIVRMAIKDEQKGQQTLESLQQTARRT